MALNHVKKSLIWGRHRLVLETGEIARQASGAVLVSMEDTVVLVTVVGKRSPQPGKDFLPLTVDYQERTYAAGKIPGGFFRREGRPSEKEILTSRLIDRPIRPLFPDGYYCEVQVVATVVSSNNEIDSDIPAMIGTSAAPASSTISLIAWITCCICWWPNTTAPSMMSSGSSFASDSTISTAC